MTNRTICLNALLLLALLSGCAGLASPSPTADVQATVDAAIAGTGTAEAGMQATIDAAVQATGAAAQATRQAEPTPTLAPQYAEMAEQTLADEIDDAVVEASQTSEEAANAATAAAADDAVTPQEVESVEDYLVDAETAIVYAEELIDAYYALYGELAMDTLLLLTEIEEELYVLAEEAAAIEAALVEIDEALLQGLALTEESLVRLESAAQTALSVAANVREQNHAWIEALPTELDGRTSTALAVQPDQVPTDRLSALQGAFGYVDAVRDGLADGKITQGELSSIAQLGANARAGLDAYGGPQLQHLSGSIDGITGQIASGQVPQARANLGGLESALGARPARPSRP